MHKLVLPSAALFALLAVTACGSSSPAEDRTTDISAADADDVADAEEIDDAPSEVEADLGSVYEFDDGLTIELSGVERATSGEWAFPESADYARFTVQVQNNTGSPVDLEMFYIQCQYGEDGRTGETVHDSDAGVGEGFTSTVMDGRNATADLGCELPTDETYLQIEVSVGDETPDDWFRPTVYFTGDV